MKTRQVSIAFQTDKTAQEYIALANQVNQYDFDVVSVYSDAPNHPSYGPLLLMAPHLQRARLGPAAVSPFRMHPIDIAANTALLAGLTQSGVYIGLARGAWLAEHGIREPQHPLKGMQEAIQIIYALLKGESAEINGAVFQIKEHVRAPYPLPQEMPPLLIGTWGPKLASLAGEVATELKIGGSANPELVPWVQMQIKVGEQKAGRCVGSVGLVMGAVTVVDEDRQYAQQIAKRSVALYLPVVAELDPTVNLDPELLVRIAAWVHQGKSEKAAALISDDLLSRFAFAGNSNDLVVQAKRLFEAGVHRVEFGTPHGLPSQKGVELIGKQVLPPLVKG